MKTLHIKSIVKLNEKFDRYDIEVEDNHNFFANGVLVHNCSTTLSIEKNKLMVYSHNYRVNFGNWYEYATTNSVETRLKRVCEIFGEKELAIQGELIGPGIQKNIYGRSNFELYIFGGFHRNGDRFTWEEIKRVSEITGIPTVPYIRTDTIKSLDDMLKDCEGKSLLGNPMTQKPVEREGLVYRTEDGKFHFKCKSRNYKVWYLKVV